MATFEEIKSARLTINDPPGFVDILQVAVLPASPVNQTAYQIVGFSVYVNGDNEVRDLYISDLRLGALIDSYGPIKAICQAYKIIAGKLGSELRFKRNSAGAETVEYTDLRDIYQYYADLYAICSADYNKSINNYTGKFGTSKQPEIAGGEL